MPKKGKRNKQSNADVARDRRVASAKRHTSPVTLQMFMLSLYRRGRSTSSVAPVLWSIYCVLRSSWWIRSQLVTCLQKNKISVSIDSLLNFLRGPGYKPSYKNPKVQSRVQVLLIKHLNSERGRNFNAMLHRLPRIMQVAAAKSQLATIRLTHRENLNPDWGYFRILRAHMETFFAVGTDRQRFVLNPVKLRRVQKKLAEEVFTEYFGKKEIRTRVKREYTIYSQLPGCTYAAITSGQSRKITIQENTGAWVHVLEHNEETRSMSKTAILKPHNSIQKEVKTWIFKVMTYLVFFFFCIRTFHSAPDSNTGPHMRMLPCVHKNKPTCACTILTADNPESTCYARRVRLGRTPSIQRKKRIQRTCARVLE